MYSLRFFTNGAPGVITGLGMLVLASLTHDSLAAITAESAALFLDFTQGTNAVQLRHGAKRVESRFGAALEFTTALQHAEVLTAPKLDGIEAMTIGGWFFPRRSGEQYFFFRGLPEVAPQGERLFRPEPDRVNFVLGTDQRGFLLSAINGNGSMPFPHVTVEEIGIDAWHQLVVVKDANGFQRFYHNGMLVHSDTQASAAGKVWPFREKAAGEPVRLAMPLGGLIGEVWIVPRELSAEEVERDFVAKRDRYHPALTPRPVRLRPMNAHPRAGLWPEPITAANWRGHRERIRAGIMRVLGPFPEGVSPLDPQVISEVDCGSFVRRKISIQVQPDDRMPAYLLIPKKLLTSNTQSPTPSRLRVPAIICFYGTTSGAGKDTTVGLSGGKPGSPPQRNRAFAIDMVEAGFVAFAPDYLRDGERIPLSGWPYDTSAFYELFPDWSLVGKDVWDNMRAIDYLQTLQFVDADRIGMVGHSYGGHSTIFAAALEPRIKVAVANGPVSDFLHHGLHWGVPKGAGNSQSLPGLRPYVLDHTRPIPVTFYEFTALIAPRPLWVGQAAGERRPMEEENHAAVTEVYQALGAGERVRYVWYAGDHDFPLEARAAAVRWFQNWFARE